MYTSQQSVENKVGGIPGWQALLTAVGFRLDPAASGLPAAVFFPTSDPGERLQQCSSTLQALLGKLLWHGVIGCWALELEAVSDVTESQTATATDVADNHLTQSSCL